MADMTEDELKDLARFFFGLPSCLSEWTDAERAHAEELVEKLNDSAPGAKDATEKFFRR